MVAELVKNVRLKLLLLFLVPSLGLLYFAALHSYEKYERYLAAQGLEQSAEYIRHASRLIQSLQKERGLSILYLSSEPASAKEFYRRLVEQRKRTDLDSREFGRHLLRFAHWNNEKSIKAFLDDFSALPAHRHQVDQRSIPQLEILEYYNRLVTELLYSIRVLEPQFDDSQLRQKITDLQRLLAITELAGQERALISSILAGGGTISTTMENYLLEVESQYEHQRQRFLKEADLHDSELYHRQVDPELLRRLDMLRREIVFGHRKEGVNAKQWWELSTQFINSLFGVQEKMVAFIQEIKESRKEEALRTLLGSLILWGAVLLLLFWLFLRIYRILQNFGKLYNLNEEKRFLYRSVEEFSGYLLEDHSPETLLSTLATLLHRTRVFPFLWIEALSEEVEPYPYLAEGIPLAKLRQELQGDFPESQAFARSLRDACETLSPVLYPPGGGDPEVLAGLAVVGIFPIVYDGQCRNLLVLPLSGEERFDDETLGLVQHTCKILGKVIDQNERLRAERRREEELRIAATAFNAQEAITITDAHGAILKVNDAFTRITGYTEEEAIGQNPNILKSGKHDKEFYNEMWDSIRKTGFWKGEIYNRRKNGEIYPEMLSISSVADKKGKITHYVAHFFDISQVKEAQETAEYRAQHDALTELYNRQKLLEELERIYKISRDSGEYNAFLFFDIDNFKHINDYHNHEFGDKVLIEVATRLQAALQGEDVLARIAGDEFAILLCCLGSSKPSVVNKVTIVIEKIKEIFSQPIFIDKTPVEITFSIGVKIFPDGEKEWMDVMINADVAMYHAKRNGKNHYHFFNTAMDEESKRFLGMKNDFSRALKNHELLLHYQPRVAAGDARLVGVEALIRWQKSDGELLMPGEFLFVTHGNSLGYELTEYVLLEAAKQIEQWQARIPGFDLQVSINLSGEQFNSTVFMRKFYERVSELPGTVRQAFEFEIVEDAFVQDLEYTIDVIKEFHELGIHFSIDDFGMGYSSINYLRRLPVETLKIDREFVLKIFEGKNDEIVKLIINTAQIFGMHTVAEGVEEEKVLRKLRELGCDYCQGFLFSSAVPAEVIENEWLRSGSVEKKRKIL